MVAGSTRAVLAGVLVLLSMVLLAGCTGYTGSHANQVHQWVQQNDYWANERQVVADAHAVDRAVASGTALQLRTVCGGLSADAGTLYGTLPTPDHTLTAQLGTAMQNDMFDPAERCAVMTSTRTPAAQKALAQINRGLAALAVANAHLAQLGIHP